MRRHLIAILLLPLLATACTDMVEFPPCPGTPAATLQFKGTLSLVECAAGAPAAGMNTLYPPAVSFTGTISSSGAGAALCGIGPAAEPLVGTLVTDTIDVALETRGALLLACNPRCAITVRQRMTGVLARVGDAAPTGFSGEFTDQASVDTSVTGATCAPCTTPCQATYLLTGLPLVTR